jgi:hypothetical protein
MAKVRVSEAYKAMNKEMRQRIHKIVSAFFDGEADYDEWHNSQCVPVPRTGNLSDPNKWRGVMLMDVCSKIFSSVMNGRAFRLLQLHGTKFQFEGTKNLGCQHGLFTLKTLLNAHKNHHLPSFVALIMTYSLKSSRNMAPLRSLLLQSRRCTLLSK